MKWNQMPKQIQNPVHKPDTKVDAKIYAIFDANIGCERECKHG